MSITFEEIIGDVTPERSRERSAEPGPEADANGLKLADRIRAVMIREARRAERLSDQ